MSRLRLGFAGTPEFAGAILDALLPRHEVAVVYCQPARPTGRGRKITPSVVETLARDRLIEVRTPKSLRSEAATLAADRLDAIVVAAYGLILPAAVLQAPRYGCINVHASLLPRWRGAAPIERAMMAGDSDTGVSIMQMDAGLDTGPVLEQARCPILPDDTGDSLSRRLATLGAGIVLACLDRFESVVATPQPANGATYAAKLIPADSEIRWGNSAVVLANRIRALNSRQPAFCFCNGERIRLLFAEPSVETSSAEPGTVLAIDRNGMVVSCGIGHLRVTRVALTRGKGTPMDIASLVNGHAELIRPGQVLATSP